VEKVFELDVKEIATLTVRMPSIEVLVKADAPKVEYT